MRYIQEVQQHPAWAGGGRRFLTMRCVRLLATAALLLPVVGSAQTVGITMYPLPTPGSGPRDITPGPDGALWFTERPTIGTTGKIGRITAAGSIAEYPGGAAGITAGPDGAMWFTEGYQIGRITTAGETTTYPYPGSSFAIATGPDGALWVVPFTTEESLNPIGRVTTDGAVTIVYGSFGNSTSIVLGPDGALWLTTFSGIVRLTTAGVITGWGVPNRLAAIYTITSGPDGALWFTESEANQIGRITRAGVITEYPVPTAASAPVGITTGPDGALWFTENGANQLGRITTAGVITEYPIPTSAGSSPGPFGITAGPDGALWFTAYSGNSIGRVALNVEPAVVGETPSSAGGITQTLTFQFSHPSGYQNLGVVNALISGSLDGRNACYLAYVPSTLALYLVDDAGDAGGPFAGQRNSQCAVSLSSATGNGTTLTLAVNVTLQPGFAGNKIVYAAARDLGAGNSGWQPVGVWPAPSATPGQIDVTGVTPVQGSGPSGVGRQFQLTIADSKGTSDLGVVDLLINGAFVDGGRACYLAYMPASNTLALVDDAGDAGGPYAGSMMLNGQSTAIENGQCQVTAGGTSAAYSNNTITLTLNIVFKAAFAGNRVLYAAARDLAAGNNTGWQAVGTWTVQ